MREAPLPPREPAPAEVARGAVSGSAPGEPAVAAAPEPVETASSGGAAPAREATAGPVAELQQVVLESVAELTGYPIEMLDLDMDLEADLGIDSIKRLEILGAVQRRLPAMEEVSSQYMGSLRTLRNIIDYASGALGEQVPSDKPAESTPPLTPPTAPARPEEAPIAPAAKLERRVLAAVELAPVAQRPIRVASGCEIWVTDDGTSLAPTLVRNLKSAGHAARVLRPRAGWKNTAERKVGGLILLGSPETSDDAAEEELKTAFRRVQGLASSLHDAAASGGALLATIARLDGAFGLRGTSFNPLQRGLSGLAKTAAHEWPEVSCRALDVSANWQDTDAIADAIVRELGADGPLEVGLDDGQRLGLEAAPSAEGNLHDLPLEDGDLVVISGGARGVTAEAALALARARRLTLVLLGRSAAPTPEPEWLAGLTEEAAIKRALLAQAFDGSQPRPAELEAEYRRRMANREVKRNLERLQASGSTVVYRSVDVRDADAVAAVLDEVRQTHGPLRGLIHGAGVIEDRRIEDKMPEQFARVFDTKVRGLRALLAAAGDDDLRVMVFFSSVTARFGRAGQVDYAMANEVLNKVARQQAAARPECRVVAINWGPWDGGMVTPALKQEFARSGIELIPREAGARFLVDELRRRDRAAVEVLVGGPFPEAPTARPADHRRQPATAGAGKMAIAFERELDVATHPFLRSHVIDGHAVLPMAMMLEWLGHGALHDHPGLVLHGLEDFRVLKGVVLNNAPAALRVVTSPAQRAGDRYEVGVELRSGGPGEKELVHARATALLTTRLPEPPPVDIPPELCERPYVPGVEAIYRDILFHGPHLQAIESVRGISERGMVAEVRSGPPPAEWMAEPLRSAWLSDPRMIDAGLQLGVLWCCEERSAVALPSYGARYRQYQAFPQRGATVVLEVRETRPQRMVADVTFVDAEQHAIARMEGQEWTVDPSLKAAFDRKVLVNV
jgi:NAD(P)-dependent dehydrogenase (short-subunit alcohol dehydrogenase family)/acyl carrier protein